jgi:hypothetical protein
VNKYIVLLFVCCAILGASITALTGLDPIASGLIALALGAALYFFVTPRRRR